MITEPIVSCCQLQCTYLIQIKSITQLWFGFTIHQKYSSPKISLVEDRVLSFSPSHSFIICPFEGLKSYIVSFDNFSRTYALSYTTATL